MSSAAPPSAVVGGAAAAAALGDADTAGAAARMQAFNDYHFSAFVAMETAVTIVPRFSMSRVECLGGSYGPFATNYPVEVPLWFALHLRQTESCTLTVPSYLRVDYLQAVLDREQASEGSFEPIPFYLFEIAKLLVERGSEDVPQVSEVVRLLENVKAARQRKLQLSMGVFEAEGSPMFIPGIKLTNLVSNELHLLRHSFAVVLRQASAMDRRRQRAAGATAMPAVVTTTGVVGAHGARVTRHDGLSLGTTSDASITLTPSTRLLSTVTPTTTPARSATRVPSDGGGGVVVSVTPNAMATSEQRSESASGRAALDAPLASQEPNMSPTLGDPTSGLAAPPAKRRRTLRQT